MQTGPPRQRGALILRDVLSFSASEAAEILGTTAVSVNSSVQRARTRVKEAGAGPEPRCEPSAAEQRAWVDRYMKAVTAEGISRNSVFQESEVFAAFGLAAGLDA